MTTAPQTDAYHAQHGLARRPIPAVGAPGNERIGSFSDGVFSIAITLLVLELHVPSELPPGGLRELLPGLLPLFAGHVISFVVLGVYWVGHHNLFLHIKRHDRVLLWLNILFLMFIAATPFFAGLIAEHGEDTTALVLYAANLVCAGLALDTIWRYASVGHRLIGAEVGEGFVSFVHRRVLMAPACYLVAIPVALVSHWLARLIFLGVILLYILPSSFDLHHHQHLQTAAPSTGSPAERDLGVAADGREGE